ncbi:MAG: ImmA/IrrE family metallo-endopeptidase [Clostridiales bacterium]|nr:ImmA/IrrE family metallo-endopeptidase [Clostridiales bacterium]
MYIKFETDPACVPYLSSSFIDEFCDDLVARFDKGVTRDLHPLNIDDFATGHMGLRLVYENMSCNFSVLGAMLFEDTAYFPVYDPRRDRAEYISAREGDVVLEKKLLDASQNDRLRYTLAHEVGHALWHGMYYNSLKRSGKAMNGFMLCGRDNLRSISEDAARLSRRRLIEYQANRSASALLMPKSAVKRLRDRLGKPETPDERADLVIYTAAAFRVSDFAAKIRLKELGML